MTRRIVFFLLLLTQFSYGQILPLTDTTNADYLYIPKDLDDVFKVLDHSMDSTERKIVKNFQEDSAVEELWKTGPPDFFYDWKLGDSKPSTIVAYFKKLEIFHPYDYTRTIIISYHRYLNNTPVDLEETIRAIKRERNDENQIYLAKMSKDSINGIYIPKDLKDCFIQLDGIISEENKRKIKELKNRSETIKHHLDLGMWIRNNWGLWGGSRLQKHFKDKKIGHPDEMSSLILAFYYDWLHNENAGWDKWMQ